MPINFTKFQQEVIIGTARNESQETIAKRLKSSANSIGSTKRLIYARIGATGIAAMTHFAILNRMVRAGDFVKD